MLSIFSRVHLTRLLLLAAPFVLMAPSQETPWVFKNSKDGVKVYYRKTQGVHEVKLISSIQTSLTGLMALFMEVETYKTWSYKLLESKVVQKISDTEMTYYSHYDLPWPLNDRDIIMHTVFQQDPVTKTIIINSVAAPDELPEKAGIVRIKDAKTTWTILPGTDGWAYTEYYIYTDPGGSVPDWLLNMTIDLGPRETIKGIRKQVKKAEYQQAKVPYFVN